MLYIYISIGIIFLVLVFIISNRYIHRESGYKKKIKKYIQNKEFAAAIEFAEKLISMHPKNPEYYYLLADIFQKAKMAPKTIEIYNKMISKKIFSPKIKEHNIREKLAFINLNQGKVIDAFRESYIIAVSNPNSVFALELLGRIYGSQHKYDKAEKNFKKAVKLKPDNAEFHYQLGILNLDKGNISLGIQELDIACKLDPEHLKCQYFLALACQQKGLHEKAKMLFEKLNIEDLSKLPNNITQIGIMTQKIPAFEIDKEEEQLSDEIGSIKSTTNGSPGITSIEQLTTAGADLFHTTAVNIISKMGYIVQKEVKTQLTDSAVEINFIAIPKKEKDNPDPKQYFIQITKTNSEIGTIPYTDFLSKMSEMAIKNGIFIITTHFASNIFEEIKKEKGEIILVDESKLTRYL